MERWFCFWDTKLTCGGEIVVGFEVVRRLDTLRELE